MTRQSSPPKVRRLARPVNVFSGSVVEQHSELRGQAIFALGYWAGCRVSDVSHLLLTHTHVGPKLGWLRVGHKGEKYREIDLLNEARTPCPYCARARTSGENVPCVTRLSLRAPYCLHLMFGHHQLERRQIVDLAPIDLLADDAFQRVLAGETRHWTMHDPLHRRPQLGPECALGD